MAALKNIILNLFERLHISVEVSNIISSLIMVVIWIVIEFSKPNHGFSVYVSAVLVGISIISTLIYMLNLHLKKNSNTQKMRK